ncbi:hypothetical protein IL306_007401 [Fusarium sp. DS 682]|nr:hypothetical protein IL306_007401 [Fusarium sp. DS 682]
MASQEPSRHQSLSSPASDDDPPTEPYSEKAPSQQEGTSAPDFGPPPDGGLQAWLVVTGGFFAVFASFGWINSIAATGTWFARHRAIAFGIITAGSSLGGVVLPIMVNKLIVRVGFGWAMRSVAFLFLGLLVIANITIKSRLPPPRRKFDIMNFVTPFKEMPFLLLTTAGFMLYLGSFLPFNFIIVQAKELGVSDHLAQYLVSIVNAASTFGRLLPAYLGDRIGVFNVMIPLTLLGGIFTLTVWLTAHSTASVIAYAALYGFTSGCTLSIVPAMLATFSDVRSLGTRNGALYGVSAIGVLIGSPVAGQLISAEDGHYSGLIIFCGVSILLGAVFATMSRQALTGSKWMKKV